jgi:hypothetical protein
MIQAKALLFIDIRRQGWLKDGQLHDEKNGEQ